VTLEQQWILRWYFNNFKILKWHKNNFILFLSWPIKVVDLGWGHLCNGPSILFNAQEFHSALASFFRTTSATSCSLFVFWASRRKQRIKKPILILDCPARCHYNTPDLNKECFIKGSVTMLRDKMKIWVIMASSRKENFESLVIWNWGSPDFISK
jgi:hypothetical protein